MTDVQTYEQFRLTNEFFPDDAIAVIFAAGVFDAVMKYEMKRVRGDIEDLQEQIR